MKNDSSIGAESKSLKNLPEKTQSVQYDLFATFYGEGNKLSNTIELWDSIPKFSCSRQKQQALRDANGRLPTWEREFTYSPNGSGEGVAARMTLTPARVMWKGKEMDFLPSGDEELIEDILRKIFADQQYGRHYAAESSSYVDFTLYMIYRELKVWGHTRSLDEIKRSLEIMGKSHLQIHFVGGGKKAAFKGAIIPEMMEVGRAEYMADPKARWRARLPSIYSSAINSLEFRQFNYTTLMSMSSQLAKWLQKRLVQRYTNAALTSPYTIRYSTIKRDSGMLTHSRESRNKETVITCLNDLEAQDVVMFYKVAEAKNDPRDPLYTLTPTSAFVAETKAANKRQGDAHRQCPGISNQPSVIMKTVAGSLGKDWNKRRNDTHRNPQKR